MVYHAELDQKWPIEDWGNCVNVSYLEMEPPFYVVIQATRRSRRLKADGRQYLTTIQLLFKTLSTGPTPGIKPTTSRFAVKRSSHWANPTSDKHDKILYYCWFARDVTAAILLVKNKSNSLLWELNSIFM